MTRVSGLLLALVLGLSSSSEAGAAPAMDWLFPAGASRGGTVEVTAGGKFDQWPAKFVCNHPGVKVSPLKDKPDSTWVAKQRRACRAPVRS